MYESYYGFKEKPFSLLPDPGFIFPSKKHRLAQSMLEYGLIIILVAILVMVLLLVLGPGTGNMFSNVAVNI